MSLKPYLQLVRLPNVFTAAADSLAGWLLVGGGLDQPDHWLRLCGASMAIYAGGIALNDVRDLAIDRVERPRRPLPSGEVPVPVAWLLATGLLMLGLGLALGTGPRSTGIVAVLLVLAVVAYDAAMKRTGLGPLFMGACRGLNLLLGMSQAADLGGPSAWLAALALAVFVTGVTWISRSETHTGRSAGLTAGWLLQNAGLAGLIGVAIRGKWLVGPLVLFLVGVIINRATLAALREPVPARLQNAVKTGVLALVWLDVGIVAAVVGPLPALAVAALWVPAFLLGKWLYST